MRQNGSYFRTSLLKLTLHSKNTLNCMYHIFLLYDTQNHIFPNPFIRHYKPLQTPQCEVKSFYSTINKTGKRPIKRKGCGRLVFISLWCDVSEWSLDQGVLPNPLCNWDRGKTSGKEEQSQKLFQHLKKNKSIYLFIFGCIGSSLLLMGFLYLHRAGATLRCGAQASPCGGFSCCGAQALGAWASVVVARGP